MNNYATTSETDINFITGESILIIMSATLCDDSQLVSTFDINVSDTSEAITPKQANDIGDRMILFPQAYSPFITDDDIKRKILEYSQRVNVVVSILMGLAILGSVFGAVARSKT